MAFHFEFDLATFTPPEAEELTPVTRDVMRDWRRRGLWPRPKGHARYDLFDLAKLLFMGAMSARGIGPSHTKEYADIAAGGIAIGAMMRDEAFDGDAFPTGIAHRGTLHLMHRAMAVCRKAGEGKVGPVARGVMPARYFILWADLTAHWDQDVQAAINGLSDEEQVDKLGGLIVVLDTWMLGSLLVSAAGRPLVHVRRVSGPVKP